MKLIVFAVFALMFATHDALAQVNAEGLRANPLQAGWSGSAEANLAISRGNIDILDVGGALRVQWQTVRAGRLHRRALLAVNGRSAERSNVSFVSQSYGHLRYSHMFANWIGLDGFAQLQYNEFLRLRRRALVGGGARIDLVSKSDVMIWGGSGYMFEYERIDVAPGAADPRLYYQHRWTNYLTVRLALAANKLLVQNTIYLQPRIDRFSDFRALNELEITAKVSSHFSLGSTLSLLHDSAPPTAVKNTDLRIANTFRYSF